MHGVINTDKQLSKSLHRSSIKPEPVLHFVLGPYAFMGVFDPHRKCNHSNQEGRYPSNQRPNTILVPYTTIRSIC
ncbi:hypothetical protein EDD15DRAFT_2269004 [Pisolithus albus]|nr:hypothetical protein EDD15DRAFT_2287879 [Pisolithus albus]KAI5993037.1 hypothetical protein EDD15DRAFT_2269004 [Pisolithus albus]